MLKLSTQKHICLNFVILIKNNVNGLVIVLDALKVFHFAGISICGKYINLQNLLIRNFAKINYMEPCL